MPDHSIAMEKANETRARLLQLMSGTGTDIEQRALRFIELVGDLQPGDDGADALLAALEDSRLVELDRALERKSSAAAIAALLRMGHPWALKVHPDDLEWFRSLSWPRWTNGRVGAAIITAGTALLAPCLVGPLSDGSPTRGPLRLVLLGFWFLQLAAAITPWLQDPRRAIRRLWVPAALLALASFYAAEWEVILPSVIAGSIISAEFLLVSLMLPARTDPDQVLEPPRPRPTRTGR